MIIPWFVVTVAVISINDVRNVNIDAAKLIDDSGSGVKIYTGVVIEFDIIEIFQSMNRFVDAIKPGMGEFVELTIHGEGDVKIARSIKEENFVLGGIDGKNEVNIRAGSKR